MEKRFVGFMLASMAVLLSWMFIERWINPRPEAEDVEQVAEEEKTKDPPDEETGKTDPPQKTDEPKTEKTDEPDDPPTKPDQRDPEVSASNPGANPRQLVALGSLDENHRTRHLVTVDSLGGTIKRIEFNERTGSGEYRYRNLDDKSGYLGHLELTEVTDGCAVGVVGHGTPAAIAGLRQDDVIQKINDEPVESIVAFHEVMKTTKPGDDITLTVIRRGEDGELKLDATLTRRPLEGVRPEPENALDDEQLHPQSMLLVLGDAGGTQLDDPIQAMKTQNWATEITKTSPDGIPLAVEFTYVAADTYKVIKRYELVETPQDEIANRNFMSYHLNFEFEVHNLTDTEQTFAYQLDGPTGLPLEGWWYQIKIHKKLFHSAGARDVVWGSQDGGWLMLGPSAITKNTEKEKTEKNQFFTMKDEPEERTLRFIGGDSQYFSVILMPADDQDTSQLVYLAGEARPTPSDQDTDLRKSVDVTFRLTSQKKKLAPQGEQKSVYKEKFILFAGPKEPELLDEYALSDVKYYGWFGWVSKPLTGILHVFYGFVRNYGIAIIMLTVLVRLCMMPISRKAVKNAQMMQVLKPEMDKITKKYEKDLQKRSQAQRELFAKYNYNPFGGCLLMFLQLPVFLGLYRGLSVDNSLRDQPLIPGMGWCSNLAAPDRLARWDNVIPVNFLTGENGWLGPYFNLLPIATVVLFLVQQKMFTPKATDDQQRMTQRMMTFMTLFIGLMFFKVPAGLCIYFITSSLWGIAERKLFPKPKLPEKLQALDEKGKGKSDDRDRGKGKSASPKDGGKPPKSGSNGAAERKARDKERQKLKKKRS